ncbi:Hypothetical predicted protein [Paramuricea clavata]|uniref:Uncharacterized protein n=1 Tax=Paramuricea clavata TaxID=317549 RepID=A0A7D9E5J9_PARCT|nr:Hypothetical predicted protein [Paramuricea clavata]
MTSIMSAKKRRLSSSFKRDSSILASPLLSEFSNSFVENMMSNDEKSGDEEPLSLVQSLRLRMDEMERESDKRQKAMADLPHMKRFKTKMKRRQLKQILHDMADDEVEDRKKSNKKRKRASKFLVMTSLEKSMRETVVAVVDQLGGYEIRKEVDHDTTHVVSAGKRRTVNVLKAILSGCWLLSVEWVLKSLEKGFWLKEEPFELVEDFPVAKQLREERSASPSYCQYQCKLLADIGPIFVSPCTSPPPQDIAKLIKLSGGAVSGTARRASVCIGKITAKTDGVQVSETWLLDCITQQTVLPFDEYQEKRNS